ncbi:hypothetical protein [Nonomuraea sp. NPDC049480]|uniref:hypothetical protein n=1 Tax=Nonomuraea sp. NPDC049480 TaxID=3364353 RepID=UPI0037ABBA22
MTDAADTDAERLAEYQRLFRQALTGRERTPEGIRFRFRAGQGVEAWVRDLAAREKACCAFFAYDITAEGDEVIWDAAVSDNDMARTLLEEFYALPDTVDQGLDGLLERLTGHGLEIIADPGNPVRQVQHTDEQRSSTWYPRHHGGPRHASSHGQIFPARRPSPS